METSILQDAFLLRLKLSRPAYSTWTLVFSLSVKNKEKLKLTDKKEEDKWGYDACWWKRDRKEE